MLCLILIVGGLLIMRGHTTVLRKTSSDWSASSGKEQNRRWLPHSCNLTGEAILSTGASRDQDNILFHEPFSTPTPANGSWRSGA